MMWDDANAGQLKVHFYISLITFFLPTKYSVIVLSFIPPLQQQHNDAG